MMEEAIQNGGGDRGVAIKDVGPLFEGFVGGDNDRSALIARTDDLEEEIRSTLINGQVANFIQDQ